MRPLKVLILNHNVEGKGTYHRCYDFAKLLTPKGYRFTIVTNHPTAKLKFDSYESEGITIVRSPDLFWGILRSGWDPLNVFRRYQYFKNQNFDLIHAFDNRPTVILPALWLSRKWKVPLVSDWCDWWGRGGAIQLRKNKILNAMFEPIETYFEEHFRQYAKFLTVISTALKERAIKLGFPKEKIATIPPLVDTQKIYPQDKNKAREKLGLKNYFHVIIFSGFVLYDFEMVLESFRAVHEQYPSCLLVLTGGAEEKMLTAYRNLPIKNLGFVAPEVLNDYLAASDVCLLPLSDCLANHARYPHKIGHYLAAGKPVITNLVGDAGRLVKEFGVGILTNATPEAFARGICEALSNPALLSQMGTKAREVALTQLSGARYADELEQIYSSL